PHGRSTRPRIVCRRARRAWSVLPLARATGAAGARVGRTVRAHLAPLAGRALRALPTATVDIGLGAVLDSVDARRRLAPARLAIRTGAVGPPNARLASRACRALRSAVKVSLEPVLDSVAARWRRAEAVLADRALTIGERSTTEAGPTFGA